MEASSTAFKPHMLKRHKVPRDITPTGAASSHKPPTAPRPKAKTPQKSDKRVFRTIWISDTHLGTRGCKAACLLHFLKSTQCDTLYLVGDIIDGWQLRKGLFWSQAQSDVIRRVLKLAKKGTKVVYIPGNHDEGLRDYIDINLAGISVAQEAVHTTADGRKLLVIHGDQFDSVVLYAKWLAFLGDRSYQILLRLNTLVNAIRSKLGLPYWSLSAYLKFRVKNAVEFICRFEDAVCHAAAQRGMDGVVCGHIHHAEIKQIGSVTYYNDGDWVESCTALVEHASGKLEILDWSKQFDPDEDMPDDDDVDALDIKNEMQNAHHMVQSSGCLWSQTHGTHKSTGSSVR